MKQIRFVMIAVLAAVLAGTAAPAWAQERDDDEDQVQESRILSDRWSFWVGGFRPEFTTQFAVGSPTLVGTLIRLEDTLGLAEDLSRGRVGGFYRFGPKKAILFDFTVLNRRALTAIASDINFEDLIFQAGGLIDSEFDNTILTVTYRHSFINNGKTEAGFTAGLSAFAFDIKLAGVALVDDGAGPMLRQAEGSESITVPVPAFGMYINHAFTPTVILRMSAGFLNLDLSDFEGRYLTTSVTVDWIFSRHFGLGAGLTRSDLDFADTGGQNPYDVEYRLGGPTLYISLVF